MQLVAGFNRVTTLFCAQFNLGIRFVQVRHHRTAAIVALIIWLFAVFSGVHSHFCLDGQEPPVSMHMGASNFHDGHSGDDDHIDMDIELPQTFLAKLIKIDLPLLLAALVVLIFGKVSASTYTSYQSPSYRLPARIRPPLRAPPSSIVIA